MRLGRLRRRTSAVALLALAAAAACAPSAPRFKPATRTEAFCGSKQARSTGIASVVTSTNDALLPERATEEVARAAVRAGDGVFVRWDGQLLALPHVSKQLGETDGYARVRAAAVPLAPPGATTRIIYLLVRDHARDRWVALQAFDVQNVCVEGKRES